MAPQKQIVNNLINDFLDQDKHVAAICHGVTVLAWARVDGVSPLAGKQVAVPLTVTSPPQVYNGLLRDDGYMLGQYEQVIANGGIAIAHKAAGLEIQTRPQMMCSSMVASSPPRTSILRSNSGTTIANQILAQAVVPNQAPVVIDSSFAVPENLAAGTLIGQVVATDINVGQTHTYAIVSGNEHGGLCD